jgi:XisH protein
MAKDTFYTQVKAALIKEGWTITHDPLKIETGGVKLEIDLAAQRSLEGVLAAERNDEKIAVEVKSFISPSPTNELHTALGQFINYRTALADIESDRKLYLAIPVAVYADFFQLPFPQRIVRENHINLLVYDPIHQEIVQWL